MKINEFNIETVTMAKMLKICKKKLDLHLENKTILTKFSLQTSKN